MGEWVGGGWYLVCGLGLVVSGSVCAGARYGYLRLGRGLGPVG